MKKVLFGLIIAALLVFTAATVAKADKPTTFDSTGKEIGWSSLGCTTIQSGLLIASTGETLTTGYDQFGYNYQAHMFNGTYDSYDRLLDGKVWGQTVAYAQDKLIMKWSDEWIANVDCNEDGLLDRGLVNGVSGGISKGWLTNHVEGTYIDDAGLEQHYTDFVKIVYVGTGGPLWGSYEIIEEVYNDPAAGYHGLLYRSDPGLGHFLE